MPSILVTGSNRGLGLEWARQYARCGWRTYATCRDPAGAKDLSALAREYACVSVHELDVTSAEQLRGLSSELKDASIDLLINNAGVYHERWGRDKLGHIDYPDWEDTLRVNVLGPMRVSEAFRTQIGRSSKRLVVAISSHMGSIADINSPNDYAYRSSKAALNAAMKGLAVELAAERIGLLLLHPGWVRTRMGGETAPLSAEESVSGMRSIVDRFQSAMSGVFYRYDGSELPW